MLQVLKAFGTTSMALSPNHKSQYGYKLVAPTVTALQLKKHQVNHQAEVKAALDAGQQPPTELPALISKEDAKDLLAEKEI